MIQAQEKKSTIYSFRHYGWAFFLAWVFCIFYTRAVEGFSGKSDVVLSQVDLVGQMVFIGLPVFASIVVLAIIIVAEKRWGAPSQHKATFYLAPLLTAIATVLLFWSSDDFATTALIFVAGSVFTGIGSGLLTILWGEYYAAIPQDSVEHLAPISAIIAAVLALIVSSMSGWVSILVVTTFPLISGFCFVLSWKELEQKKGIPEGSASIASVSSQRKGSFQVLKGMWRTGLGILVACLFGSLEGSFWTKSSSGSFDFQLVLIVSIVFTALIAFASTSGPRRITIPFLYRWMCPIIVFGFVAMVVFEPGLGDYLAFMILVAVRFAFCLITQMYFARYASYGRASAVQSFGFGWLFVHIADLLGVVVYRLIKQGMAESLFTFDQVAVVCIGILIAVTMLVLNDEKSFSIGKNNWDDAQEKTPQDSLEQHAAENVKERVDIVAAEYDLTPRETEVLDLLARGRSVPYIRDVLFISKGTVATHVKSIYAKTDVHSRQELIDLVDHI